MFGRFKTTPFIGLPGDPVSAFAAFEVFLKPVLLSMLGTAETQRMTVTARLLETICSDDRETYMGVDVKKENGEYVARLAGSQCSGDLYALAQANALLIIPSGVKSVPFGGQALAWLLNGTV